MRCTGRFAVILLLLPVAVCTAGQRPLSFSAQFNVYRGSIVGRNKVDGISGATHNLHSGTVGVEYNLHGHFLQGQLTFGRTKQTLTYNLPAEGISGTRDINLLLLDLPLMYNFHFFNRERSGFISPRLILSTGGFFSIVLRQTITDTVLNAAGASSWALGPFVRAAYFPFTVRQLQPGIFLEFYRSFIPKFYDDRFFRDNAISGQLGILSTGFIFRL